MSKDDYARLKIVLGVSTAAQGTEHADGERNLRLDKKGRCFFLRQDRLCGVQVAYGEAALPKRCSEYPRRVLSIGAHHQMAGTMSCPEVARLCLSEEWELQQPEGDPAPSSAGALPDVAPYRRHFEQVRNAFLRILGQRERSIEARLEALVSVAEQVSDYFHEQVLDAEPFVLADRLESDFGAAFMPRTRRVAGLDDVMALRVGAFFLDDYEIDRSTRLGQLVERIRSKYERTAAASVPGELEDGEALAAPGVIDRLGDTKEMRRDARGLLRLYRSRRASIRLGHPRAVERYFTNYCLNYVMVEPYFAWPDLKAYARDLALTVAALRFLLFSHPGVCVPWEGASDGPEARDVEGDAWSTAALERAAVETFQALCRSAEQTALLEKLRRATGIDDTPGAIGLLGLVSA